MTMLYTIIYIYAHKVSDHTTCRVDYDASCCTNLIFQCSVDNTLDSNDRDIYMEEKI